MEREIHCKINRLNLKISDKSLEKDYRNASVADSINQFRYAFFMGIVFFVVFIIIDLKTFPEVATTFIAIRLFLVVPLLAIGLLATFSRYYQSFARYINLFCVMIAGVGLILMLVYGAEAKNIGDIYVSMILVLLFLYAFFKMPFMDAFVVGTSLVASLLYLEYLIVQPSVDIYLVHVFNLIGANIAGASIAYVMEYQSKKEYLLKEKLAESVIKDALTDLYNRHYFNQFLVPDIEYFIARSKGVKHIERRLGDIKTAKYGLFMIDIDYFKRVNDTFGHYSGDLVLQQFARILKENVRHSDDVLRVGGEEFLLVMKLTTDDYLVSFMKTIGQLIANYDFVIEGGGIIGCTASIGLVIVPNPRTDDVDELVRYADRALYRSKDQGRNRGHRSYELQGEVEFEEIRWDL